MAEIAAVQPVQLIAAVLTADTGLAARVEAELERRFSPIEARSAWYDFEATGYYEPEMGGGLKRVLHAFRDLISPEAIAEVKLETNVVEAYFLEPRVLESRAGSLAGSGAAPGRRRVNIDPGYMDFHKLVLASAKFLGRKICVGKGIYADPTLYYDKGWKPYSWGFPDFRDGRYDAFLTQVRTAYKAKLKRAGYR